MSVSEPNSTPRSADQGETPEDVATLYSWANLHGAKYRDFSASRAEAREEARRRAEDARAAEQRRLAEEAERKAQEEAQIAARLAAEAAEAARQAEAERMAEIARQAEAERQAVLAAQEAQRLAALQRSWEPKPAEPYTGEIPPRIDESAFEPLPYRPGLNSVTPPKPFISLSTEPLPQEGQSYSYPMVGMRDSATRDASTPYASLTAYPPPPLPTPLPIPTATPGQGLPSAQDEADSPKRSQESRSQIRDPFAPRGIDPTDYTAKSSLPQDSQNPDLQNFDWPNRDYSPPLSQEFVHPEDLDIPYTPSFLSNHVYADSYMPETSSPALSSPVLSSPPPFFPEKSVDTLPPNQRQPPNTYRSPNTYPDRPIQETAARQHYLGESTTTFPTFHEQIAGSWNAAYQPSAQFSAPFPAPATARSSVQQASEEKPNQSQLFQTQYVQNLSAQSQPYQRQTPAGQVSGNFAESRSSPSAANHPASQDLLQPTPSPSPSADLFQRPQTPSAPVPWQNVAQVFPPPDSRRELREDPFANPSEPEHLSQFAPTQFSRMDPRDTFARPAWLAPELPTPAIQQEPASCTNPSYPQTQNKGAAPASSSRAYPQPNPAQSTAAPTYAPPVHPFQPHASQFYAGPSFGSAEPVPSPSAAPFADPTRAYFSQSKAFSPTNQNQAYNQAQTPPNPTQQPGQNSGLHSFAQTSTADQSLLDSRDRIAHRWYALRNLFDPQAVPEQSPVQAPARVPALAVFSLAGGVGKTSLVAALGRSLASRGETVLLVDTAIYGLMPFYFGARDQRPGQLRTFNPPVVTAESPVQLITLDPEGPGPGGDPTTVPGSVGHLDKGQFSSLDYGQDWLTNEVLRLSRGSSRILIDLPTASGATTRRILKLAPIVIVPVVPDMNSVVSVSAIESFFRNNIGLHPRSSQSSANNATMPYYLLNQFDYSLPLHLDVREVLRDQLGDRLLPFALRRSPAVSEALAEGMTVIDYAPAANIAEDYAALAGWARNLTAPANVAHRGVRWSER